MKKYYLNIRLCFLLFLMLIISLFTIKSSQIYLPSHLDNLALKQLIWYIIGIIVGILIIKVGNRKIFSIGFFIYGVCILTLILVLIFGENINGSKCWIIIPKIGTIQISEFMKVSLIIVLSSLLKKYNVNNSNLKEEIILFLKMCLITIIPSLLTFLEPDTGAVIMYLIIFISCLLISPIRKKTVITILLSIAIIPLMLIIIYIINKNIFINIFGSDFLYRVDRLIEWKKGSGMQLENSLIAIGSSGMFGNGYMKTPIYFPEANTDFIFSVFTSNFGIIGASLLLIIVILFDIEIIRIGKNSKDFQNKVFAFSTVSLLFYQQIQNISMTVGLLPITGITLPFISYGGSSLLSYLLIFFMSLNIYNENKKIN